MIHTNTLRRIVPWSFLGIVKAMREFAIFIYRPTVPIHCTVQVAQRNVHVSAISLHHLSGRTLRLAQLLLPPVNPIQLNPAAVIVRKRVLDVFIQEQSDCQHITAGCLMPKMRTRIALHAMKERTTAVIWADGLIAWRGTTTITVKIAATASRPVTVKAMATAAGRTVPFIGATTS